MYHFFVRRRIRQIFASLNRGDFAFVLRQFAPAAEHWFSGHHALAGKRTTATSRAAWYDRLSTVFPGIQFVVQKIVVSGAPWRTHVAIEWTDRVFGPAGELRPNRGVFVLTLRWGRAVEFHVYCDTQDLAANLADMTTQGVPEAGLPAIADTK